MTPPAGTVDRMLSVAEIWRYSVKSLGGERLDAADVDERGITGDRGWGLLDPATGLVLTARREPPLLFLSARLVDGAPEIRTDTGDVLADDDALSDRIGRPVRLVSADEGPGTFENPMDVDRETDWMQWTSSGGTLHDSRSKVSLVTRASIGEWDLRRFRINLILDSVDGATLNDSALSGEVAVGSARLAIRKPIDRCVMVTRAQPGIERDLSVLKRIIAERDNQLGVGAVVTEPGRIAIGDLITRTVGV